MQSPISAITSASPFYLLFFLGMTSFTFGITLAAEDDSLGYGSIAMLRGIGMVIITLLYRTIKPFQITYKDPVQLKKLFIRNSLCCVPTFAVSIAIHYLPQATVHTVGNSSPIFAFVVDYFMTGAKIKRKELIGLIIGFLGIIVTTNSKYILILLGMEVPDQSDFDYKEASLLMEVGIVLFLAMGAICWSIGAVLTKSLKSQPFAISFHLGLMMTFIGSFSMMNGGTAKDNWSIWKVMYYVLVIGALLGGCNCAQMIALKHMKNTGNVTMIGFGGVIIGYLIEIFRYNEKVNAVGVVGSSLVFLGLFLAIYK